MNDNLFDDHAPAPAIALAMGLALAAAGCSSNDGGVGPLQPPPPASDPTATYHESTRALFETHCTSCHAAGGIGPFALTDYASALAFAPTILAAVEDNRMPPWMPTADCRTYQNERKLTAEEKTKIRKWVEAGAPEGDPATYVAPTKAPSPLDEIGPPSITLSPAEAYMPSNAEPDDYHCFPLEHEFTEETYLVLTDVVPGHKEIVHHVIIFLIAPQYVPQLATLDAAEPGIGYTCFGGPGVGTQQNIGAWVPGSVARPIEEGAAIRIPAGSKLVMQIHYNTLAADPIPDKTDVNMWFRPEQPEYLVSTRAFPYLGLDIPAGDANSHQTRIFRNNSTETWLAGATALHMHLLGTRISLTAIHADNSEECIADIPRWNFHWQQSYRFLDGQEVRVAPGESVRLDCWYDNSQAHQPYVAGVQKTPERVRWGEGTLDEMCLGYLMLIEPYAPVPVTGAMCPGFQACYDQCAAGSTPISACAMQCSSLENADCAQCVVPGVMQCAVDDCPAQTDALVSCFEECQMAPDSRACIRSQCLAQIFDFDACAAPKIETNECDTFVAACGADL